MSRTWDQSSHSFLCLKMNLPAKRSVREAGVMWGTRLDVGSYSLVEVVEIIEDDDSEVEPHQREEEDEEEEKEPTAVTLEARDESYTHTFRAPSPWPGF